MDQTSHSHGHIRPSILIGGSIIIVILIVVNAYLFLTPPPKKEDSEPLSGQTPVVSPTPEPKKPLFFLSWFAKPTSTPVATPKVVPTKRPIYALPGGVQVYTFSHGKSVVGPKIQTATIDQLTPKVGEEQTVTIAIKHDAPITGVAATVYTDTKEVTQAFTKVSGSETEGTWKTTWKIPESYDYRYLIQFHLRSPKGNFEGGLTFRQ